MASQLSYHSVCKTFKKGDGSRSESFRLIENFSLEVKAGEKVLLYGKNGAGKTTLLKLGAGLLKPDSGKIDLDSVPIRRSPREKIGLSIPTQCFYEGLTGYQNLEFIGRLYGLRNVQEKIRESSERWGMDAFLHDSLWKYSAGMRALLSLSRATLHNPSILLIDEPLAFLDTENIDRTLKTLFDSPQTLLITAHNYAPLSNLVGREVAL